VCEAGGLQSKFLPRCLVHLPFIPVGSSTGKPLRLGLAERLGLPLQCEGKCQLEWVVCVRVPDGEELGKVVPVEKILPVRDTAPMDTASKVHRICLDVLQLSVIEPMANLLEHGLDSITAVALQEELSTQFGGLLLDATLMLDHPTVVSLAFVSTEPSSIHRAGHHFACRLPALLSLRSAALPPAVPCYSSLPSAFLPPLPFSHPGSALSSCWWQAGRPTNGTGRNLRKVRKILGPPGNWHSGNGSRQQTLRLHWPWPEPAIWLPSEGWLILLPNGTPMTWWTSTA